MSRSYKKTPVVTDRQRPGTAKYFKRRANKKVRRYGRDIANGKSYRKVMESWEIRDYVGRWSKEHALHDYHNSVRYNWMTGTYYNVYSEYKDEKHFLDKYWKKGHYRK